MLFVFRKYKKSQGKKCVKHPKLIVDENDNEYGFMGLTSAKKKGRGHNNIPLLFNPQKGNIKTSYLRRKIEYDDKKYFGEVLINYCLSKIDEERIKSYVKRHKKR